MSAEGTWRRSDVREPSYLASAWTVSDSPPGLGYDRHVVGEKGENAPGAPGFGAAVGFNPTFPYEVRVSELMFETAGPLRHELPQWIELYNTSTDPVDLRRRRSLPKWIELYNPSFLTAVNLKDFQFVVETRKPTGEPHQLMIELEPIHVLPNQTVLLITKWGRHSKHFPANRIYNLSERHPDAFESLQASHRLLGNDGFLIQLSDATGNVVDTVGNIDLYPFTEDAPAWTLPMGETPEGTRASIRRLSEKWAPLDGTRLEGWVSTAAVPPAIMTYYGDASDVGNPGYRKGGPLPVALSRFQAVRNADAVVVSWTTESSLENAGFNLYRSAERKGGFIRVNPRLIQGAGTTAERRMYTYVDNPPKTDVVYYYQLQEVSYSGQQQVLATCRVKGYLSADGKHLTTLGAIKTEE